MKVFSTTSSRLAAVADELPYLYAPPVGPELPECLVLKNGAFVGAFEIEPRAWECLTNRDMDRHSESMHQALRQLPEDVDVQFDLLREPVRRFAHPELVSTHPGMKLLEKAKREFLESSAGGLLENRITCWLTYEPTRRAPGSFGANILKPLRMVRNLRLDEDRRLAMTFKARLEDLGSALAKQGAGLEVTPMRAREMVSYLRQVLNPGIEVLEEPVQPYQYLGDRLCDVEISLGRKGMMFGRRSLCRVVTIKDLPDSIYAYQLRPLMRLPFPYRVSLGISLVDQETAKRKQESMRNRAHAMINGHLTGSGQAARDIDAEQKASDHEACVRAMAAGWKLLPTSLIITIWGPDKDTLDDRERQVRRVISQDLSGSRFLGVGLFGWEAFRGTWPGNHSCQGLTFDLLSPKPACLITGMTAGTASRGKVGDIVFQDREGALLSLRMQDIGKKVTSRNQLIFAETGGGKTFYTLLTMLAFIGKGARVRALSAGKEYELVTRLFGGTCLEFDLRAGERSRKLNMLGFAKLDGAAKARVIGALELLCMRANEQIHPAVEGVVCRELDALFADRKDGQELVAGDLQRRLLAQPDRRVQDLGERMSIITEGQYAGILNQPSGRLLEEAPLVYYDFHGVKGDERLTNALVFLCSHDVLAMAETLEGLGGQFIMDEAWRLMRNAQGARLVEEMARRGRAQGMSTTFISQSLRDFEHGDLREGLLEQCAYQVIFKANRSKMAHLAEVFRLNPAECALIDGLQTEVGEYSEAFLITPQGRMVGQLRVSPLHYWTVSSDKLDRELREETIAKLVPRARNWPSAAWAALQHLARRYPRGARAARTGSRNWVEVQAA